MKLFGSAPAVIGGNSSTGKEADGTTTSNEYTFCASCENATMPTKPAAAASGPTDVSSSQLYLARIDRIDSVIDTSASRRSSTPNIVVSSAASSLPSPPSSTSTTFVTTGSGGHRFVCTTVQSPAPLLLLPVGSLVGGRADRRRGSEMAPVTPAFGQRFRHRLLSLNPIDSASQPPSPTPPPPMPSALRARSGSAAGLPLRLIDVPSRSMGSLNVRRRESTTPTSPLTANGNVRWSAIDVPSSIDGRAGPMSLEVPTASAAASCDSMAAETSLH